MPGLGGYQITSSPSSRKKKKTALDAGFGASSLNLAKPEYDSLAGTKNIPASGGFGTTGGPNTSGNTGIGGGGAPNWVRENRPKFTDPGQMFPMIGEEIQNRINADLGARAESSSRTGSTYNPTEGQTGPYNINTNPSAYQNFILPPDSNLSETLAGTTNPYTPGTEEWKRRQAELDRLVAGGGQPGPNESLANANQIINTPPVGSYTPGQYSGLGGETTPPTGPNVMPPPPSGNNQQEIMRLIALAQSGDQNAAAQLEAQTANMGTGAGGMANKAPGTFTPYQTVGSGRSTGYYDESGSFHYGTPSGGGMGTGGPNTSGNVDAGGFGEQLGDGNFPWTGKTPEERQKMAEQVAAYTPGLDAEKVLKQWDTADAKYTSVISPTEGPNIATPPPYVNPTGDGLGGTTPADRADIGADILLNQMQNTAPVTTPGNIEREGKADVFGGEYSDLSGLSKTGLESAISSAQGLAGGSAELSPFYAQEQDAIKAAYEDAMGLAGKMAKEQTGGGMGSQSTPTQRAIAEAIARAGLTGAKEQAAAATGAYESAAERAAAGRTAGTSALISAAGTGLSGAGEAGKLKLGEREQDIGQRGQDIGQTQFGAELTEQGRTARAGETISGAKALSDISGARKEEGLAQQKVDIERDTLKLQDRLGTGELDLKKNSQTFIEKMGVRDRDFQENLDTRMAGVEEDVKRGNLSQAWTALDDARNEFNQKFGQSVSMDEWSKAMDLENLGLTARAQDIEVWGKQADASLAAAGIEQRDRESIRNDVTTRMQALMNNEVNMAQLGQTERELVLKAQEGDEAARRQLFEFLVSNETSRWQTKQNADASKGGGLGETLSGIGQLAQGVAKVAPLLSDRKVKEDIQSVNESGISDKFTELPVSTWKYKHGYGDDQTHIGPMAQDFKEVFGTGGDGKSIAIIDALGVLMAGMKDVVTRLERLEKGAD